MLRADTVFGPGAPARVPAPDRPRARARADQVAALFFIGALGFPSFLLPVQLLFVNLVTDSLPATALIFNPRERGVMGRPPRPVDEPILDRWALLRYTTLGLYVGAATVGAFDIWYTQPTFLGFDLAADGHTFVSQEQLLGWAGCSADASGGPAALWSDFVPSQYALGWSADSVAAGGGAGVVGPFDADPCDYFGSGKAKAATLGVTTLVCAQMANALNGVSERDSLLVSPPWRNPTLLLAVAGSLGVHAAILYVEPLAKTFSVVPLSAEEWAVCLALSAPVIAIEEAFKLGGKIASSAAGRARA